MEKRIRIVIVDDSPMFRIFLKNILEKEPSFEVVSVFASPLEAIKHIPRLRPDVATIDMEMPFLRGDELIQNLLQTTPGLKAVVVSSIGDSVFNAIKAGATDFLGKPGYVPGYTNAAFARDIVEMIKIAAKANRIQTFVKKHSPATKTKTASSTIFPLSRVSQRSIIAIGASTGGTEAILEIVRQFPVTTPGVVIVQHMPAGFTKMYADRIDNLCEMSVREACDNDRVERGNILIAPGGNEHMRIKWDGSGYCVNLSKEPKVSGHCPSVDVLFNSVADSGAGVNAVGIILTGMGSDGAAGLRRMLETGAHTIGQNEETCVVYGMPNVAYCIGGVVEQQPLGAIAHATLRYF